MCIFKNKQVKQLEDLNKAQKAEIATLHEVVAERDGTITALRSRVATLEAEVAKAKKVTTPVATKTVSTKPATAKKPAAKK